LELIHASISDQLIAIVDKTQDLNQSFRARFLSDVQFEKCREPCWRVKDQITLGGSAGRKKGTTILKAGIVCSNTLPVSDLRSPLYDREFQRPPSFQPYIGSVAGELPRTLTVSQERNLTISSVGEIAKIISDTLSPHIIMGAVVIGKNCGSI